MDTSGPGSDQRGIKLKIGECLCPVCGYPGVYLRKTDRGYLIRHGNRVFHCLAGLHEFNPRTDVRKK